MEILKVKFSIENIKLVNSKDWQTATVNDEPFKYIYILQIGQKDENGNDISLPWLFVKDSNSIYPLKTSFAVADLADLEWNELIEIELFDNREYYQDINQFDFGEAIHKLKAGSKVARNGWNGKGMFLYYVPANNYKAITEAAKSIMDENGNVPYAAYIAMKTAQGYVVPWLASQTDVLAEDWVVVE